MSSSPRLSIKSLRLPRLHRLWSNLLGLQLFKLLLRLLPSRSTLTLPSLSMSFPLPCLITSLFLTLCTRLSIWMSLASGLKMLQLSLLPPLHLPFKFNQIFLLCTLASQLKSSTSLKLSTLAALPRSYPSSR